MPGENESEVGMDGKGDSWRPPFGAVLKDASDGPGAKEDPDLVKNLEFIKSFPLAEYEKYMGEWIAVAGGKIVAHGKSPERVLEEGWNAGEGEVFMEYVYASPEEVPFSYTL